MSKSNRTASGHRLYPAYCFRASPTYNAWVKLTGADIQGLQSERAFQGQHIYFHLNHPIRYVRLVGVVVAIDDINIRYTVLTIDDGSGANVEVKIVRLIPDTLNPAESRSDTMVDNVKVISRLGVFDVRVDHNQVEIGTVIKVKGTISEFRGAKQLEMKRAWVVSTTNEEAQAWAETATFKRDVLSRPWHISSAEHTVITKEIKREKKKAKELEKLRAEHKAKREEHRRAREEYLALREAKLERRRRREEAMMNASALI